MEVLKYQAQYVALPVALWCIGLYLTVAFLRSSLRAYQVYVSRQEAGARKYQVAAAQVGVYVAVLVAVLVAGTRILTLFGVPLGAVVSVTTLISAAVGFGAKDIVGDLFRGMFIIVERQYGDGDVVILDTPGGEKSGTVVGVTLRATKLRTVRGEEIHIPNGSILTVTNQTQHFAVGVCDIPVPPPPVASTATVEEVLRAVCADLPDDPEIGSIIDGDPEYVGLTETRPTYNLFRVQARVPAGRQWEVERRVRALCVDALADAGVSQADVNVLPREEAGT